MAAYDDSFLTDDDEELCPLCIEEMDISDKNFKPCPCGFQICQFCYNNIRSNPELNGRCPACRRTYDDESIEYKTLTQEDIKREQARKQKKELERKMREREKNKENDQSQKKHRASMRVIQKNLVYVIGLNPNIPPEELQQMLRRDEYFGQYGAIQKIVINKRINGNGNPGIGVYVTFARKEDAARCIAAVDGSINDGKYLRAAYGTTKYCSSYLRNQNCPNPNCMFLHEPGEEADSFNRRESAAQSASPHTQHSQTTAAHPHQTGAAASVSAAATVASSAAPASAAAPHAAPAATAAATPAGPLPAQTPTPVLAAANTPALPAWGKTVPQTPSTQRVHESIALHNTSETLRVLTENMALLSMKNPSLEFRFVSDLISEDSEFPAMFELPLDDKRRLKVYNQAVAELDKLTPAGLGTQSPAPEEQPAHEAAAVQAKQLSEVPAPATAAETEAVEEAPTPRSASAERTPSASPGPNGASDLPRTKANNNSSQLLAHLLHDKQQAKPEDVNAAIVAEVDRVLVHDQPVIGTHVAEVLRRVGADITQPAPLPKVSVPDDIVAEPSNLVDSGTTFDLNNLPEVDLVGDVEPSVWTAIEQRNRLRQLLATQEKEYTAARAQTKKRLKRLRI